MLPTQHTLPPLPSHPLPSPVLHLCLPASSSAVHRPQVCHDGTYHEEWGPPHSTHPVPAHVPTGERPHPLATARKHATFRYRSVVLCLCSVVLISHSYTPLKDTLKDVKLHNIQSCVQPYLCYSDTGQEGHAGQTLLPCWPD